MTDKCICIGSGNIGCLSNTGIIIKQPSCQSLDDENNVPNPYYDVDNNVTYYSFQLLTHCENESIDKIDNLYITIGSNIPLADVLSVKEIKDMCNTSSLITSNDENDTELTPVEKFKFLNCKFEEPMNLGSSCNILITFAGKYNGTILTDNTNVLTDIPMFAIRSGDTIIPIFADNEVPILIPEEVELPRLTIIKKSDVKLLGNGSIIEYEVTVSNAGNVFLENIQYTDEIIFDGINALLSNVKIQSPDNIESTSPKTGVVDIKGSIGNLDIGKSIKLFYTLELSGFIKGSIFNFNSTVVASSGLVQGSVSNVAKVPVGKILPETCCRHISSDRFGMKTSIINHENSPTVKVKSRSRVFIPEGIVIKISSFFGGGGTINGRPASIGSELTNVTIDLYSAGEIIPNATKIYGIIFDVISSIGFAENKLMIKQNLVEIENDLQSSQLLIIDDDKPSEVDLILSGRAVCQ